VLQAEVIGCPGIEVLGRRGACEGRLVERNAEFERRDDPCAELLA
jgi:hypothetical protein